MTTATRFRIAASVTTAAASRAARGQMDRNVVTAPLSRARQQVKVRVNLQGGGAPRQLTCGPSPSDVTARSHGMLGGRFTSTNGCPLDWKRTAIKEKREGVNKLRG